MEERLHDHKVDRLPVHCDRIAAEVAAEERAWARSKVRIVSWKHAQQHPLLGTRERLDEVPAMLGKYVQPLHLLALLVQVLA